MNCFRPLEHWDFGFESHLRHGRLCVFILFVVPFVQEAALRRVDPPSNDSYRLYKKIKELKKRPRSNKGL
jgi:hypothetical protein